MITKGADKCPSDPIFYLFECYFFYLFKCLLVIIRGSNDSKQALKKSRKIAYKEVENWIRRAFISTLCYH